MERKSVCLVLCLDIITTLVIKNVFYILLIITFVTVVFIGQVIWHPVTREPYWYKTSILDRPAMVTLGQRRDVLLMGLLLHVGY